ncbi:MAG: Aconitate hydratase A [Elusimicrobia bacterium]|nr:Aconitate hydratase A [Elusimicrobiota bacterium]
MDSFNSEKKIKVGQNEYVIRSLPSLVEGKVGHVDKLPFTLKILLENLLRQEDGINVTQEDIQAVAAWDPTRQKDLEISFMPARVILQDFTGVPCVVDMASMRDAVVQMGGDPEKINPLQQVDLVIDHSVQVDRYGSADSFKENVKIEYERNKERYSFLKWGQKSLKNFRVVPPGTGIVHQVNLEYLGQVVYSLDKAGRREAYPDTVIGTDSHTTMINGLGIVGWGVGGIEAEAAMLGQPVSMLIPEVVGFKLFGKCPEGTTATDLVLVVTQMLRKKGVVGKFVEFYGKGLSNLTLPDRATLANMAPEYGATVGFFPVDEETLTFLKSTGRSQETVDLVKAYATQQGLFRTDSTPDPLYSDKLELDLSTVIPSVAGPKRPQDRVSLAEAKASFETALPSLMKKGPHPTLASGAREMNGDLKDGSIVIAAITSCTNTSNPSVMIQAGLLAKNACDKGLKTKPWVKTSLAPGSKVVMGYLEKADVLQYLEKLGFYLVGYGCTTCIGNSGPLDEMIEKSIKENELVVASVLSGNRNFEGRIHASVRANYLMSPPLVVAYALAGSLKVNLTTEALGQGRDGKPVFLKDIWPNQREVQDALKNVKQELFKKEYAHVFEGDDVWKTISFPKSNRFDWEKDSTYIRRAAFLENLAVAPAPLADIRGARVLASLGDSVTTDHISPAGSISAESPAGKYLLSHGVPKSDFNSYGARRGNHEVMVRGTFANNRLKNQLAPGTEGGVTKKFPEGTVMSIYDAALAYAKQNTPLIILAGKEYGSGSSRDWAAKGTMMLGVKAVIAESYERIHRSNLVMMGVLPLQFPDGKNAAGLDLSGEEVFEITGVADSLKPLKVLKVRATLNGVIKEFNALMRIDTPKEIEYYQHGGVLPYVLRRLKGK